MDEALLIERFTLVSEWLEKEADIILSTDRHRFETYTNPDNRIFCQGRVYFKSHFAEGKKSNPKIKLNLTADEVLVTPPERRTIFHPYSDEIPDGTFINCYSL